MSLGDIVKKATAAVVPKLIGPDGFARSTVDTTRFNRTQDAAARATRVPFNPLLAAQWKIAEIRDGRAQRIWGTESNAAAEATILLGSDVQADDVVTVIAGDFAGNTYEVEQIKNDPLGNRMIIALAPTGQTKHVAGTP